MSLTVEDLETIKQIVKDALVDAKFTPAASASGENQTKIDEVANNLKYVKADLDELKNSINQVNSGTIPRQ